jgi:hypothetical protein
MLGRCCRGSCSTHGGQAAKERDLQGPGSQGPTTSRQCQGLGSTPSMHLSIAQWSSSHFIPWTVLLESSRGLPMKPGSPGQGLPEPWGLALSPSQVRAPVGAFGAHREGTCLVGASTSAWRWGQVSGMERCPGPSVNVTNVDHCVQPLDTWAVTLLPRPK